jgi:hypothetical protein
MSHPFSAERAAHYRQNGAYAKYYRPYSNVASVLEHRDNFTNAASGWPHNSAGAYYDNGVYRIRSAESQDNVSRGFLAPQAHNLVPNSVIRINAQIYQGFKTPDAAAIFYLWDESISPLYRFKLENDTITLSRHENGDTTTVKSAPFSLNNNFTLTLFRIGRDTVQLQVDGKTYFNIALSLPETVRFSMSNAYKMDIAYKNFEYYSLH